MIYLFVVQYPTGDYLYVHNSSETYPCLLSQATMFETYELAENYCKGKCLIRKLEVRLVN